MRFAGTLAALGRTGVAAVSRCTGFCARHASCAPCGLHRASGDAATPGACADAGECGLVHGLVGLRASGVWPRLSSHGGIAACSGRHPAPQCGRFLPRRTGANQHHRAGLPARAAHRAAVPDGAGGVSLAALAMSSAETFGRLRRRPIWKQADSCARPFIGSCRSVPAVALSAGETAGPPGVAASPWRGWRSHHGTAVYRGVPP